MRQVLCISFILFLLTKGLCAQNPTLPTQRVKGKVTDTQSEMPLIGATVQVVSTEPTIGTVTDVNGRFVLEGVPVGRQTIAVSYIGYASTQIPNVMVTAGKEVVLEIGLEESIVQMDEVVVKAETGKDRTNNEMASVSARSFTVEEVQRFSGGRNDVSRLVSNFAGVSAADDSRNDIVIRGNSPTGVLWRLEGVPIPNPNHFSTLGTTGGPVSAINPNMLRNSDFLTSAFPAEYGNALGGVFDLGFRSGNKDEYEFTAQMAAFSGLELMAEGPLGSGQESSFLVAYRHSFVQLADQIGIPIGTNATPDYRDLSFKLDFKPTKAGKFSVFGIGGLSRIDFLGNETDEDDLFANPNQDAFPRSQLGIAGVRHNLLIDNQTYLRTVLSFSRARNTFDADEYLDNGNKIRITEVEDATNTLALSSYVNRKYNARLTVRAGVVAQRFMVNTFLRDRDNRPDSDDDGLPDWVTLRDFNDGFTLLETFVQSQYRLSERWTLNTGLHAQYFDFTEDLALEPRVSISRSFGGSQKLTLGYGLHHQVQPLPVFLLEEQVAPGQFEPSNTDLSFTRAHHLVLGYDWKPAADWRVKAETYYQALDNVPVDPVPSSFSMLNAGADFVFPERYGLVNEGTGANYGVELTVEKFFSNGYYGLLTGTLYESKYEGSDGVERNTAFNNQYILNFLAGKEWKIGKEKRNAFTLDMRLTTAGGAYYTPVDLEASRMAGEEVLVEEEAFSLQYDPYFRLDIKVGVRLNSRKKKISQLFFLDFQNITNRENIFALRYNEVNNEINEVYQAGFFPDIMYRIQF